MAPENGYGIWDPNWNSTNKLLLLCLSAGHTHIFLLQDCGHGFSEYPMLIGLFHCLNILNWMRDNLLKQQHSISSKYLTVIEVSLCILATMNWSRSFHQFFRTCWEHIEQHSWTKVNPSAHHGHATLFAQLGLNSSICFAVLGIEHNWSKDQQWMVSTPLWGADTYLSLINYEVAEKLYHAWNLNILWKGLEIKKTRTFSNS